MPSLIIYCVSDPVLKHQNTTRSKTDRPLVEVYLWRTYAGDPSVVKEQENTISMQVTSCKSENMK